MPLGQPIGAGPIAGGPSRSTPTVAVTSPTGTLTSSPATAVWSFTSPTGRDQHRFRVRYLTLAGDELYDSGFLLVSDHAGVDATSGSYEVPYTLTSGAYRLELTAGDTTDLSAPVAVSFTVDVPTAADTPDLETVGSVFDVAIAGVGYVLSDQLERRPVRRTAASLQSPRLATSDTPFSQAIDRYSFSTQLDWSGGAGQRTLNRSRSDDSRFFRSDGIDPFSSDCLKLLPATTDRDASTDGGVFLATAGDELVAVSSDNAEAQVFPSGWGSSTDTSLDAGAQACTGLTSDGLHAYASLDEDVYVYNGSSWAQHGSTFTGSQFTDIGWCSDRLAVGYTNSSDQGVLSTLDSAGAEEVPSGRFLFPNGTVKGLTAGDGYLWFGVNTGRQGIVYAWQLGSSDSRFVALRLPTDQTVESLFFYLGNVMVGARNSSGHVSIFRAVPSSGALTPELVFTSEVAGGRLDFTSRGALVFFTWTGMAESGSESGIGAFDLETGGHCSWSRPQGAVDTVGASAFAVANWAEELVFSVSGPTGSPSSELVFSETSSVRESGWLESSTDDLGSALSKVFDDVQVRTDTIVASGDVVEVEVSVNGGQSFDLIGSLSGAGASSAEAAIGLSGSSVTSRVTLRASTGEGPCVRMVQVKLHPLTLSDQIVELPIDLGPRRVGLNGRPLPSEQGPMEMLRALEALVGARVRFQDVDWPVTKSAGVWELTGVDASSAGSFSRSAAHRVEHGAVAVVTLRRPA